MLAAVGSIATLALLWLATDRSPMSTSDAKALGGVLFEARGWLTGTSAILFSFGSTAYSWVLVRGRMIPALLGWLGILGSLLLVAILPLQLVGLVTGPFTQWVWLPMAAYEIPLGFWLLIRGVAAPTLRIAASPKRMMP